MHFKGQQVTGWAVSLAILSSCAGFIFGYDTGQISGILIMDDFKRRFAGCAAGVALADCKFNVWREGTIVALLSVGTAAGALAGASFADLLGRRKAMSLECAIFIIGVVIQVTAQNVWQQVAVGRLISGVGVGALSAAAPLFTAETAPRNLRGSFTACYQLLITFGILVAACINTGTQGMGNSGSWRIPVAIGIIWALILGIGILFMPESPRWLLAHGKEEEARRAVDKFSGTQTQEDKHIAKATFSEISKAVAVQLQQKPATWIDPFKIKHKTLYRTILGMSLQSLQQLTGANYFFYYGATIFLGVGISNSFVTQIILNAVNFVCTFGGLYIMEKFNRRVPLMVGGIWQGVWLIVFSSVGTKLDPQTNKTSATVMIISACMFILGYATTWAPGVWIVIGETFPTRLRAKQGAISTFANWVWNFLIAFFTQPIVSKIGYRYGYLFAACNIFGSFVVYFFLYESGGLSLEGIDEMYNDPAVKPWTSSKYVPAGYETRHGRRTDDESDDARTVVDEDAVSREPKSKKLHAKV